MSVAGALLPVAVVGALVSGLLTFAALRYARWRRLVDAPGRRRLHVHATPRGGGIAIVVVVAAGALWSAPPPPILAIAFVVGLAAVAGIGWIDDHRPLSARVRLIVHLAAAALFVAALWRGSEGSAFGIGLALVAVVGLAGAVNAWNFMDGSNGLVTTQSAWVASALAAALVASGAGAWAMLAATLAGACLGFLPFNFPRARIFLGDVGSGGLGFACGALWLLAWSRRPEAFWWLALLPAPLLVDAGLTLLQRIVLGRRWYSAHREHLYQWLVRAGASHAQVAVLYLVWSVLALLPVLMAHRSGHAAEAGIAVAGVSVFGWVAGKRAALRRVRRRSWR